MKNLHVNSFWFKQLATVVIDDVDKFIIDELVETGSVVPNSQLLHDFAQYMKKGMPLRDAVNDVQ